MHTFYCARAENDTAPLDMDPIFTWETGDVTMWSAQDNTDIANPHYDENAFMEVKPDYVGYMLFELDLPREEDLSEGQAWPIEQIKERLTHWYKTVPPEMGEPSDPLVDHLNAVVALGSRHGATHLVLL